MLFSLFLGFSHHLVIPGVVSHKNVLCQHFSTPGESKGVFCPFDHNLYVFPPLSSALLITNPGTEFIQGDQLCVDTFCPEGGEIYRAQFQVHSPLLCIIENFPPLLGENSLYQFKNMSGMHLLPPALIIN